MWDVSVFKWFKIGSKNFTYWQKDDSAKMYVASTSKIMGSFQHIFCRVWFDCRYRQTAT
jgi:hypothetical protein